MKLTKIDVAEAQIRAAVRLFFEGGHPVPVYTLANAAREIVATIGEQITATGEWFCMWRSDRRRLSVASTCNEIFKLDRVAHPEFGSMTITATMPWRENAPEQEQVERCVELFLRAIRDMSAQDSLPILSPTPPAKLSPRSASRSTLRLSSRN